MPLRLPSAADLVLVAEGGAELGQKNAGMAEQIVSRVWGLILQALIWWLSGGCIVGEFGSSRHCGGAVVLGGGLRGKNHCATHFPNLFICL